VALNSHDQVVGEAFAFTATFGQHAILYDARLDPPMQDLNDLIPPDSGIELSAATPSTIAGALSASGQSMDSRRRCARSS
jgi:hypothetical protein